MSLSFNYLISPWLLKKYDFYLLPHNIYWGVGMVFVILSFQNHPLQFHKKSVYLCLLCNANKNRHLTKRSQQCNKSTRQHPWIFSKNQKIYKIKDKLSSSLLFSKMTFLRKIFFHFAVKQKLRTNFSETFNFNL